MAVRLGWPASLLQNTNIKKMQLTVFFKILSLSNSTTCLIKKKKNNKERLRQGVDTK